MMNNEENQDFLGLGKFIWWFGVVEDRLDPLNLGRCRVRCFGWHSDRKTDIETTDLPWAHPVIPYGTTSAQPPVEGTMVFGFFADGKEGRYPILIGTVPGIPEEVTNPNIGFSDPYTEAEKSTNTSPVFPRRVANSTVSVTGAGPTIQKDYAKRFPSRLNEPTISRLARPNRIENANTGSSEGVFSSSIEGTTIDFQRKNRVVNIKSAKTNLKLSTDDSVYRTVWNEPFPSYNAKYPFNNVTETESGHTFELDDTPEFERVQISHRTGSTLEFMPSGSIKEKSFKNKYDIVMGNQKTYINGTKEETVQSDMFLKINGELVIQCDGFTVQSAGDIKMKSGGNIRFDAEGSVDIFSKFESNMYGAGGLNIKTEGILGVYGGYGAVIGSGGVTSISGVQNPGSAVFQNIIKTRLELFARTANPFQNISKKILKEWNETPTPTMLNSGVKIVGPNFWITSALTSMESQVTNILGGFAGPTSKKAASTANNYRAPIPKIKRTNPSTAKEPTDSMAFLEKATVYAENAPQAKKLEEVLVGKPVTEEELRAETANLNLTRVDVVEPLITGL
jgi:hypothetical protein